MGALSKPEHQKSSDDDKPTPLADLEQHRATLLDQLREINEAMRLSGAERSDWLSIKECAFASGFSEESIRRWAQERTVSSMRSGGRVLVLWSDVARRMK
jgi:hypothetical protein